MQQQLNQQREAAYQPNFNAQKQVQQERFNTFNTFNTNMILLDGQNRQ